MYYNYKQFKALITALPMTNLKQLALEVEKTLNQKFNALHNSSLVIIEKDKLITYLLDILSVSGYYFSINIETIYEVFSVKSIEYVSIFDADIAKQKAKEKEFYRIRGIVQNSIETAPFYRRLFYLFNSKYCIICR
jgi:hypothetical protein